MPITSEIVGKLGGGSTTKVIEVFRIPQQFLEALPMHVQREQIQWLRCPAPRIGAADGAMRPEELDNRP